MSKKETPFYQVDAFTSEPFSGNPAAVCIMDELCTDEWLQQIAEENNLSETAFVWGMDDHWLIRWFTPNTEIDLCGHATLAAAHALFEEGVVHGDKITFDSRSGNLIVLRSEEGYTMDFPADSLAQTEIGLGVEAALGKRPVEAWKGRDDILYVFESHTDIIELKPDIEAIKEWPVRGVIVTAPGTRHDFVSRFFAPSIGIAEDPVTGSAHTTLTSYWTDRLGKKRLDAAQLSARRGQMICELVNDRVLITGQATTFLRGVVIA